MTRKLLRAYLDFLRTPHAARLLGGTLLGRLPNGMGPLAVTLFVRDHHGSLTLAGVLSAIYGLAMALGQPALGRAMDRYGQQRVLLPGALLAAGGFILLVAVGLHPLPVTVAAALVAGFATPPLEAGLRALWPTVLPGPAQVRAAYSLDAASQEMLFTFGPLIVVGAVAISTDAAVLLTGALGVLGTLVVTTSGPSRAWRGEVVARHWAGPLRSTGLRILLGSMACIGVSLGAISVAAVTYADERHSTYASGLLLALNAGGALIGGIAYGMRPRRQRVLVLTAGLALCYLPLALAPTLPAMAPLTVLSGIFLAPTLACAFTLVDGLAPRGTVTEAFGWLVAAMGGGGSAGMALAGILGDQAGSHGAFAVAGAGGLAGLALLLSGSRLVQPAQLEPA